MSAINRFIKDPQAVLDWKYDWAALTNGSGESDWLESGETIASHTVAPDTGITVDGHTQTDGDTSVTVWLSGGTAITSYNVTCHIITTAGREDDRTIIIDVEER